MWSRAALLRGTAAACHKLLALPQTFFAIFFFFNMITAPSSFAWASSSTRYDIVSFKNPMASLTGSLYGLAGCPSSYDVLSTPDDDYADTRDNKFSVNNMGLNDHSLLLVNPSSYSTPFTSPVTIVTTSASTSSCDLSTTSRGHDFELLDTHMVVVP